VVGDQDQCLPPGTPIATPEGDRPIEALSEGDEVVGMGAAGTRMAGRVTAVRPGTYAGRMYTVRAGGHVLRGTPITWCWPTLPSTPTAPSCT
jgi:hypothetical protein